MLIGAQDAATIAAIAIGQRCPIVCPLRASARTTRDYQNPLMTIAYKSESVTRPPRDPKALRIVSRIASPKERGSG
jgi:hypothetical protein